MENRLKKVMSKLFDLNETAITTESSINNIEKWDSLRHLKLISLLEDEFKVMFAVEDIVKMTSFSNIKEILLKKIG